MSELIEITKKLTSESDKTQQKFHPTDVKIYFTKE